MISIHSAARAETQRKRCWGSLGRFQSTPPRGRRPGRPLPVWLPADFNPLRREGGDLSTFHKPRAILYFNPLRREGGDQVQRAVPECGFHFNPLRREGGDSFPGSPTDRFPLFQSTPPRGRRRYCLHGLLALMYFNPLRREGGDDGLTGHLDSLGRISIHSAARAETFSSGSSSVGIIHFNPLRREGGDGITREEIP